MKSNPVRLLFAAIACLVLQTGATSAAAAADPKPEEATYLVTVKRTLLSGEVVSESTTSVSSYGGGNFEGTIPVEMKEGPRPPLLVTFDINEEDANFSVMDPSLIQPGMNEGRSYSIPLTILETHVIRKKSDVYTLLGTDKEKLTISFKKVDPKELDEVPMAKEGEGKK